MDPITAFVDRLLVDAFLDLYRVWEEGDEEEGDEALLSRLRLRVTAKEIGLDRAEKPPDWIEADDKLKHRWLSARAWYLADRTHTPLAIEVSKKIRALEREACTCEVIRWNKNHQARMARMACHRCSALSRLRWVLGDEQGAR